MRKLPPSCLGITPGADEEAAGGVDNSGAKKTDSEDIGVKVDTPPTVPESA